MQIRRDASHVHRVRGNYNNNGSHNSVSPYGRRLDDGERIAARGSRSLSLIPRCACVHIGKLSKLVFIAGARRCLPCVYTESLKHSRVCFGCGAARREVTPAGARSAVRRTGKASPLTIRQGDEEREGAVPLSEESTLGKHQCAMGKFFGFRHRTVRAFCAVASKRVLLIALSYLRICED